MNYPLICILNIETSTKNCSVTLARDGKLVDLKEINNGKFSHAEVLHQLIKEILIENRLTMTKVDAVAVGKGPGSFTGLRIGVSAAKGLCFANDIPLISHNSLETLAHTIKVADGYIIPMIDARRMEVYSAVYSSKFSSVRETKAEVIHANSYAEELLTHALYFLGDGAAKCKKIFTSSNAVFIDNKFPSAKEMAALSFSKYKKNHFEDVAYFEPYYLKNFIATKEKSNLR